MPVKHTFVSAIPDDPAAVLAGEVVPTNWNATHDLSTLVAADVTDFNSAAVTANASAVSAKADKTTTITGGTGLTGGGDLSANRIISLNATTALVPDSTNRRYVTDAQLVVIGNTSGTNTGDQTITLTGDVTGSGTGSFAATIANNAVTNAKTAQMGANTIKGNNTGGTANATDLSIAQATAMLNVFTSALQGMAPASGGGTTTFLRADGTWATPAGGDSVPGSNTQVIFNDSGALGADAALTYDKSMQQITIGTAANGLGILSTGNGTASDLNAANLNVNPGAPFDDGSTGANAGNVNFTGTDGINGGGGTSYSFRGGNSDTGSGGNVQFKSGNSGGTNGTGGITFELGTDANGTPGELSFINVATVDPQDPGAGVYNSNGVMTFSGSPGAFAASALMNYVNWWPVAASATPAMAGSTSTTSGLSFSSLVGSASTDAATRQQRARGSTGASAGATGVYTTNGVAPYTGVGPGSYHEFLTGVGTNLTGHQVFVGLNQSSTSLGGDPSALTNIIGIGFDAADLSSGNWKFYTNDGSGAATKIDTGIARGVAQLLWVQLYNRPASVTWDVIVTDMVTGTVYTNSGLATNTPPTGTQIKPYMSCRTGATTTAAALDIMRGFSKWMSG